MSNKDKIVEFRGVKNLVFAEILEDSEENFTTGEVTKLAGVAEISKTTESSNEAHYYDNIPACVVSSIGSDEVTCSVSAIPLETVAKITGQFYDEATGMFIEGTGETKYFAMGYITEKTDGSEVYVWRLKGTFNIPDSDHKTKDDSTDAEGQELVYTGISTTHKFEKTGSGEKAINVELDKDLADVTNFFTKVQTPDTIVVKSRAQNARSSAKIAA